MSDTADDLLNELEQLESASTEMQSTVQDASDKHKALENAEPPSAIDAATLSLEAAKTAQSAAEQSQNAAEVAIKLSNDQKAQIIELSDSNVAWRQSLRAASNDLKSARNAVTIMMTVSILFSTIAAGVMGWLYYSMSKKYDLLKGDVFDILSTENKLFHKSLTLKIDQVSSLIEALAGDIQRLQMPSKSMAPAPSAAKEPGLLDLAKESHAAEKVMTDKPAAQKQPSQTETKAPVKNKQPHTDSEKTANMTPVSSTSSVKVEKVFVAPNQQQIQDSMKPLAQKQEAQLAHIEALIEKIIEAQQKVQASTMHQSAKTQLAPVEVTSMGLTESQVKKLNGISWTVAQQTKLLKEIKATLKQVKQPKGKSSNKTLQNIERTLNQLNVQVKELKTQQSNITDKVHELQSVTKDLAARPSPYRYQSPKE